MDEGLSPKPELVRDEPVSAGGGKPALRYAWYVVFALMVCYTLSFVDRQVLSLLVGPIKRDLAVSDTRIGLLQGLAFSLFYALMGLPLGRMADLRNRRNFIAGAVVLWSFFTASCSAAQSFWSLFLRRIGVGVGEAGLSPAAYSLISDYFPKEHLGSALGLYSMGIYIGSGLALIIGGSVVDMLIRVKTVSLPVLGTIASWRVTFLVVGAPGLLFALLVFTIREPLRRSLLRDAQGEPSRLGIWETIEEMYPRWRSVAGASLGMLFRNTVSYGFLAWAPTFFVRTHAWTPGQAGRALGAIVLIFGCSGMVAGGWLGDHWQRRGMREARFMVAVPSAAGMGIFFLLAMTAHNPWWTLAWSCPAVFFLAMPVATVIAGLQLIFPNQLRGQVSALHLLIINLGGQSLGPLMPALFNDYFFKSEKMLGPSMALTLGIASALTLVTMLVSLRPYRADYQAMHG